MADNTVENISGAATVWVSSLDTYALLATFKVWGVSTAWPGDLVRWGDSGLAFAMRRDGVCVFKTPSATPSSP